jgi:hypothetical protein
VEDVAMSAGSNLWGFEKVEARLRDEGVPLAGKAAQSLAALKASGLTEEQATALWHFVSDLLSEHAEVVRLACVRAIQEMAGIPGRD